MGEISPAVNHNWGIFRASRNGESLCDNRIMRDIQEIRTIVRHKMNEKRLSRRKLSGLAGMSESGVRDFLTRTESPGIATLQKLAVALEMPIEELTGESAGAGDQWQPRADTVQIIVEVALLPFPQSRVTIDDLPIFAHAVTEAVRYVASDPARAEKSGFRDAVEAIVETAVRSYRQPSEQAA